MATTKDCMPAFLYWFLMCTCISHALASSHDRSNVLLQAVRHSKAAESITCTGKQQHLAHWQVLGWSPVDHAVIVLV
jgi:hypothetical protein